MSAERLAEVVSDEQWDAAVERLEGALVDWPNLLAEIIVGPNLPLPAFEALIAAFEAVE